MLKRRRAIPAAANDNTAEKTKKQSRAVLPDACIPYSKSCTANPGRALAHGLTKHCAAFFFWLQNVRRDCCSSNSSETLARLHGRSLRLAMLEDCLLCLARLDCLLGLILLIQQPNNHHLYLVDKISLSTSSGGSGGGLSHGGGGEVLVHAEDACDDGGKQSYTAPTQLVHIGGLIPGVAPAVLQASLSLSLQQAHAANHLKVPTANHHTAVFQGLFVEERGLAFPSADIAHGLPVRIPRRCLTDSCVSADVPQMFLNSCGGQFNHHDMNTASLTHVSNCSQARPSKHRHESKTAALPPLALRKRVFFLFRPCARNV